MKDLKHFVVDVNPTYSDTRCFFAVRNDGTREDFSVVKCINNIEDKFSAWFINKPKAIKYQINILIEYWKFFEIHELILLQKVSTPSIDLIEVNKHDKRIK